MSKLRWKCKKPEAPRSMPCLHCSWKALQYKAAVKEVCSFVDIVKPIRPENPARLYECYNRKEEEQDWICEGMLLVHSLSIFRIRIGLVDDMPGDWRSRSVPSQARARTLGTRLRATIIDPGRDSSITQFPDSFKSVHRRERGHSHRRCT
jgi:hypothetical protein